MTRLYSLLAILVLLGACSSFESHDDRRSNLNGDGEVIDLTVRPNDKEYYTVSSDDLKDVEPDTAIDFDVQSPYVADPVFDPSQQERKTFRVPTSDPKWRRVNRNVEVYSLD